jgi:predicted regulator of Ras-like GTPase activity (Roadblock/LC7/MglB family)
MLWYIVLELIYFYAVYRLLNPGAANRTAILAALTAFIGRLLLSTMFLVLLLVLGSEKPSIALSSAFGGYKPALLLFSLTAPVACNSIINALLQESAKTGRRSRRSRWEQRNAAVAENRPIVRSTDSPVQTDFFNYTFEGAVRHVGGYSGVLAAFLIDQDGLLVAQFSRSDEDGDVWSGLALKLVSEFEETLLKAGLANPNWIEFAVAQKRFYLLRVKGMWLLSVALATTDELERIRMQQAAEMIAKYCQERYCNLHISETERSYAGSTVGA